MKRFIVLLLGTITAFAQTPPPNRLVVGGVATDSGTLAAGAGIIGTSTLIGGITGHGQNITGAPYSALEVTEHIQTLADGTHITQPSGMTMYYRDSQGRTRIERTPALPPGVAATEKYTTPSFIEIHDPVAGVQYSLDTRNHQARKNSTARITELPLSAPPPTGSPTGKPQIANRTTFVPNDQRQRPEISSESLGTQIIEGVTAEGSRTTTVYPVNFFGNDRPITTVSETWTSTDLKLTVLSKNSDPRSGERTMRLTNISRAEPDPALFQVPSDYEIIDSTQPRVVR